MRTNFMLVRLGALVLAVSVAAGCASLGGPGARVCAPYLIGGAAVGAGLGVVTADDGNARVRQGAGGAVLGAAAGYGICVAVWRQKAELEARFAALEQGAKTANGAKTAPGTPTASPVVRSIDVLENRALRLDLDLNFVTGQSRLDTRYGPHLDVIATHLGLNPGDRVLVVGHTDSVGDPARNRTLSRQRAIAVMAYLVEHGVDAGRLQANGMGSDQPVADNGTEDGRRRNRRVEIIIVPTAPSA